ncbi:MAG: hypothetical protein PHQ04_04450 [Opitutaceae bacterium]|nr:hypothetical protein [Opitutaceae bacterium]
MRSLAKACFAAGNAAQPDVLISLVVLTAARLDRLQAFKSCNVAVA